MIDDAGTEKKYEQICKDVQDKLKYQEESIFNLQDEVITIGNQLESIAKEVEYLLKLIRDGNGKPSVISQIYLFNNLIGEFKEKLEKFDTRMDAMDKLCVAVEVEKIKAKWQMLIILVSGGLTFLSSILILIFKFILG